MCACEHVIITTAIVFTFLFFVLIFSTTLFMSNDFQKSQTLSLFQVGEHSIEIIIKDEQLNVTPNFYTYDSSKIKVPQKFSTLTTTQKESKCWTWPQKYRLGPFHRATSASQLNLTVSFFLFLHLFIRELNRDNDVSPPFQYVYKNWMTWKKKWCENLGTFIVLSTEQKQAIKPKRAFDKLKQMNKLRYLTNY